MQDSDRGLGFLNVRAHGLLWLRLRALASQTGEAQSGTLVVYTVYSMALGLVAAMGVLIALTHADMSLGNVMQALFMVQNLHHIYTVHEHGHRAAKAVCTEYPFCMTRRLHTPFLVFFFLFPGLQCFTV